MNKLRLSEDIEKHIRTTFIGAIAAMQKKLGFLWGEGKNELTDIERKYLRLFGELRTEILDFGNNQMRTLLRKIEKGNYENQ